MKSHSLLFWYFCFFFSRGPHFIDLRWAKSEAPIRVLMVSHPNGWEEDTLFGLFDYFHCLYITSKFWPNQDSESGPRLNFITTTILQQQNADQTSVSKSRLTFNLTEPCAESLNKSLALWPNLSFQICNKLLPTRSSSSTSATVTTSISFELASSHARVTSIKFTKRYGVNEWVSEWVSDNHSQWSDSGPIKTLKTLKTLSPSTIGGYQFTW